MKYFTNVSKLREKANYSFGFGLGLLTAILLFSGSNAPSWSKPFVIIVGFVAIGTAAVELYFARRLEGQKKK